MNGGGRQQPWNSHTTPKDPQGSQSSSKISAISLEFYITRTPEPQCHPHGPPELHKHTRTFKTRQTSGTFQGPSRSGKQAWVGARCSKP